MVTGEAVVEAESEGWWFTAPDGTGNLVVARFTDRGLLQGSPCSSAAFERALRNLPYTSAQVAGIKPETIQVTFAGTDRLEVSAGEGWCAVGDAALACDPLGSQGLLRSFESAEIAAQLSVRGAGMTAARCDEYSRYQMDFLERFRMEHRYFYSTETRWPHATFWERRSSQLAGCSLPSI